MNELEELKALRRMAELEDKAGGKQSLTKQDVIDPTEGNNFFQNAAIGLGKSLTDKARSFQQMTSGMGLGGAGLDDSGKPTSPESKKFYDLEKERQKTLQAEIDESKRLDAPLMKTGGGIVGNLLPDVATALIPGAGTIKGATAIGAGLGFMEPVATGESRAGNTATSAAFSGGATAGLNAIGRVIKPKTGEAVKKLMDEGVLPTPGQVVGEGGIVGKTLKRIEDSATSIPIIGDMIKGAQKRGIESFNTAAVNRVLKPIGVKLGTEVKPGHQAVATAHETISGAYDELLPKLKATIDDEFKESLTWIRESASILPDAQAKQFDKILDSVVGKRLNAGTVSGENLKFVQSELRQYAQKFSGKQNDANSQLLGEALNDVKSAFDDVLKRQNPKHAERLKNINRAYANLTRVERAAAGTGTEAGVFTPSQLNTAVKAKDTSLNKRQFAHGESLMQDFADTGKKVLADRVPDSGTMSRAMAAGLLGGSAAVGAGTGYIPPEYLVGGALLGGAYSKPGQKALIAALTKRPDAIKNMTPDMIALINALKAGTAQGISSYNMNKD